MNYYNNSTIAVSTARAIIMVTKSDLSLKGFRGHGMDDWFQYGRLDYPALQNRETTRDRKSKSHRHELI